MAKRLALDWLEAAKSDLKVIEKIIDEEYLTHMVAFHSQQAIEKALKAILEYKNENISKIHKLQTLFARCNFDFKDFEEEIILLDELYIDSRYPSSFGLLPQGKPSLEQAKRFFSVAQTIYKKAQSLIDG